MADFSNETEAISEGGAREAKLEPPKFRVTSPKVIMKKMYPLFEPEYLFCKYLSIHSDVFGPSYPGIEAKTKAAFEERMKELNETELADRRKAYDECLVIFKSMYPRE